MKVAMILAAGRGERLRPSTDILPKALCQVQGKPLIEYHLEKLANAGFKRVIINHAHLGGQIRQTLGNGKKWDIDIIYSPEPPGALETGGGIYNALALLGKAPFLTVNADIFTDYDFRALTLDKNSLAKLVLVPKPAYKLQADFGINAKGILSNIPQYTFAGIACYHPNVFQNQKLRRCSVIPTIRALAAQQLVRGDLFQGLWIDIGEQNRLEWANSTLK